MEELKPCPFCGAFGSLYDSPNHSTAWEGGCSNNKCPAWDVIWEETRAEAIAAWNRRAPDAALIEAGDRLAGFAGHDHQCFERNPNGVNLPRCTCGYTEAWKKWKEVRGERI